MRRIHSAFLPLGIALLVALAGCSGGSSDAPSACESGEPCLCVGLRAGLRATCEADAGGPSRSRAACECEGSPGVGVVWNERAGDPLRFTAGHAAGEVLAGLGTAALEAIVYAAGDGQGFTARLSEGGRLETLELQRGDQISLVYEGGSIAVSYENMGRVEGPWPVSDRAPFERLAERVAAGQLGFPAPARLGDAGGGCGLIDPASLAAPVSLAGAALQAATCGIASAFPRGRPPTWIGPLASACAGPLAERFAAPSEDTGRVAGAAALSIDSEACLREGPPPCVVALHAWSAGRCVQGGEACQPRAERGCEGEAPYWQDICGGRVLEIPCAPPDRCDEGRCTCERQCDGRACGPDGCGGRCGECEAPEICDEAGACVCVPQCEGLACGDDGCGGRCGDCAEPTVCMGGVCACTGPTCGGTCCGPEDVCLQGACCQPQCDGATCGDDGCGGSCGTCYEGTHQCVGGACVERTCQTPCEGRACGWDEICGQPCGACEGANREGGERCVDGRCLTCPDQAACGGVTCGPDPICGTLDCGACGAEQICRGGRCEARTPALDCPAGTRLIFDHASFRCQGPQGVHGPYYEWWLQDAAGEPCCPPEIAPEDCGRRCPVRMMGTYCRGSRCDRWSVWQPDGTLVLDGRFCLSDRYPVPTSPARDEWTAGQGWLPCGEWSFGRSGCGRELLLALDPVEQRWDRPFAGRSWGKICWLTDRWGFDRIAPCGTWSTESTEGRSAGQLCPTCAPEREDPRSMLGALPCGHWLLECADPAGDRRRVTGERCLAECDVSPVCLSSPCGLERQALQRAGGAWVPTSEVRWCGCACSVSVACGETSRYCPGSGALESVSVYPGACASANPPCLQTQCDCETGVCEDPTPCE